MTEDDKCYYRFQGFFFLFVVVLTYFIIFNFWPDYGDSNLVDCCAEGITCPNTVCTEEVLK